MGRILAISDVHGFSQTLKHLLKVSKYNPDRDRLILLGDYIDRGPDSPGAMALVKSLVAQGAVALLGNHEDMLLDYLSPEPLYGESYLYNGGARTLEQYAALPDERLVSDLVFIDSLPLMFEYENFIFVHAGLNPLKTYEQTEHDLLWIRDKWWEAPRFIKDKVIVFGHTNTAYLGSPGEVFVGDGIIGIDTGVYSRGGRLTLLDLSSRLAYQATGSGGITTKEVAL